MTYRTSTIKRARRTKSQVDQLDRQIMDVLRIDQPQSIRHVFYRMTNPRLPEPVEKSDRGYRHVQNRITVMRRSGVLPYGWISDTSRRGYFVNTFSGAAEFLRRMNGLYRADLWADAGWYVEVWVESRSIAGVIQSECEELAVSLYPCGGFSSMTLAYEAAMTVNRIAEQTGRRPVVLYIGDFDPSGVLIDVALERELREHVNGDLDFIRLAITPEQIATHDLPTKPRKAGDRRSLHVTETVEAEAMPAGVMRQIIRDAIERYLPPNALAVAKAAEDSERDGLARIARVLTGNSVHDAADHLEAGV